tara:strand:+ start:548 stop:1276 length:729 start_codon:yes stop_codon:yes gene_type:complete
MNNSQWLSWYKLLKDFRKEFPDRWPKAVEKYNNVNLGSWCLMQRRTKKINKITKERIQLLDDINFTWNPEKEKWHDMYNLLKQFRKEFPNRWPSLRETYNNQNLGMWTITQRQAKKGIRKNKITSEQIQLLNEIGFVWDQFELSRQTNFELYKKFKEEFNREPKQMEDYEGMKLGRWVGTQRIAYKKGLLDDTKIELLNQAGFVWELEGRLRKQITETLKSINDPSILKDIIKFIESRIKNE